MSKNTIYFDIWRESGYFSDTKNPLYRKDSENLT